MKVWMSLNFGKFATEFLPLIDVRIEFLLNILKTNRPIKTKFCINIIVFCIRVRTSLIFSSVKLLQSKTQSLLPGVGGVSMVISCQKLHPLFTYGFDVCIQGSFYPFQV